MFVNDNKVSVVYNTSMRALSEMYARLPEDCRLEGGGQIFQTKPECPMLICNTSHQYQANGLHRVINHPSQYEYSHWIYYICIPKNFDYGSAATVVHSRYDDPTDPRGITVNFSCASLVF